jgi:hypothetical protein
VWNILWNFHNSPTLCLNQQIGSTTTTDAIHRHAWHLSFTLYRQRAFQRKLLQSLPHHIVASFAATPKRASTNRLYDGRWRRFTLETLEIGINHFNPNAPQLTTFLHYLRSVKDLNTQTVKGIVPTLPRYSTPSPFPNHTCFVSWGSHGDVDP